MDLSPSIMRQPSSLRVSANLTLLSPRDQAIQTHSWLVEGLIPTILFSPQFFGQPEYNAPVVGLCDKKLQIHSD